LTIRINFIIVEFTLNPRKRFGKSFWEGGELDMSQSNTIKSSHVRFGKRTYFFDINQKSGSDKKYLRITESQFQGEGKERKYNSFILFAQDVKSFQDNLKEVAGFLGEN